MHIVLVNDDGIQSAGIRALCLAAVERGHRVSVCAPSCQQSAASQRITLSDPIYVKPYDMGMANVKAWAIGGTPTDCIRLGLLELIKEPIDVVISGINDGYNAGMAVHYSGTVGAATEAALFRYHSMAVSIHHKATPDMLAHFARLAIVAAESYAKLKTPPVTVLNINAPLCEPSELKPCVMAPLSLANFTDTYLRAESPRAGVLYWLNDGSTTEEPTEGSDQYYLDRGHITFTFIGNPTDQGAGFASFVREIAKADLEP